MSTHFNDPTSLMTQSQIDEHRRIYNSRKCDFCESKFDEDSLEEIDGYHLCDTCASEYKSEGHFYVEVENLMEGKPTISIKVNYSLLKELGVKYFTLSYLSVFAHYQAEIEENARAYVLDQFGEDSQIKFEQI